MTAAQMTALGRTLHRIGRLLNAAGRALTRRQWLRTGIFLRRAFGLTEAAKPCG